MFPLGTAKKILYWHCNWGNKESGPDRGTQFYSGQSATGGHIPAKCRTEGRGGGDGGVIVNVVALAMLIHELEKGVVLLEN